MARSDREAYEDGLAETNGCFDSVFGPIIRIILILWLMGYTASAAEFLGLANFVDSLTKSYPIVFYIYIAVILLVTYLVLECAIYCLVKMIKFLFDI